MVADTPLPWDDFRDELRDALQRTIVSHRADHGQQGKLHEETAYGIIKDPEAEDGYNLVYRKPFAALNKNEIARIRDLDLRVAVEAHVAAGEGKLDDKLRAFGDAHGIRRVRLLKKEQGMIHISERKPATFVARHQAGAGIHRRRSGQTYQGRLGDLAQSRSSEGNARGEVSARPPHHLADTDDPPASP